MVLGEGGTFTRLILVPFTSETEMTDQEDDDYEERYWVAALRAYPEYGLSIQQRLLLALIDAHPTVAPDASEERKQEAREDRLRKAMQIVFGLPKRDGRDSSLRPIDDIARGWISDQLRRRAFQQIQHEMLPEEPRWKPDFTPDSPGGLRWSEFGPSALAKAAVVRFYGLDPDSPEGNQVWERIRKVSAAPKDKSSPEFFGWFHEDMRVDWALEQVRDKKLSRALELLQQVGVNSVPNLPHGSPRDE